jgi:hypothetical protein
VILDTQGNIFGGLTPVEWESRVYNGKSGDEDNCNNADDSQKSFLFTLKNPYNIPARRFALKAEQKYMAIRCDYTNGPCFATHEIVVFNECNAHICNSSGLGIAYTNDAGLDVFVFTGSLNFQAKEIEVFEITG